MLHLHLHDVSLHRTLNLTRQSASIKQHYRPFALCQCHTGGCLNTMATIVHYNKDNSTIRARSPSRSEVRNGTREIIRGRDQGDVGEPLHRIAQAFPRLTDFLCTKPKMVCVLQEVLHCNHQCQYPNMLDTLPQTWFLPEGAALNRIVPP